MGERMVCGRNSERAGLRAASVPLECAAWELCSAARGACEHGRSQLLSSVLVLGVSTSLCHAPDSDQSHCCGGGYQLLAES